MEPDESYLEAALKRQQSDFKARYVLKEVCDRLAELTGDLDDGGAVVMADRTLSLPLSLAILSVKRDALLALAPEDPLNDKAENVLRVGYAAR